MEAMTNVYKTLVGSLKGTNHFKDLSINGRIILKCIFSKTGCVSVD
jgi:hypothetical protein